MENGVKNKNWGASITVTRMAPWSWRDLAALALEGELAAEERTRK